MKKNGTLKDKNINLSNYASFSSSEIIKSGRALRLIFACGATYDVDLAYFIQWFDEPHYYIDGSRIDIPDDNLVFVQSDLIISKSSIRVSLNNNAVYEFPWDTVLMACEENYEHFGGLTEKSKGVTRRYLAALRMESEKTPA